ncbi:MAG: hypothetical protein G5702_07905 [Serratia symbiotica]|nr:hypothetical protein [Serratia symbiotica]
MAVFNQHPLFQIVNLMETVDCSGTHFIATSPIIRRRKTLGEAAIREIFDITQQHWNEQAQHLVRQGLNLFAVGGVV